MIFGSAHPQSISAVPLGSSPRLELGGKRSLPLTPVFADLGGITDVLIGADAWKGMSVTFDWQRSLVVVSTRSTPASDMYSVRFSGTPTVPVVVDGRQYTAIVDAASPDTLQIPAEGAQRRVNTTVALAESTFRTDVLVGGHITHARVGARLLANFLLTIDYKRREVRLWRRP